MMDALAGWQVATLVFFLYTIGMGWSRSSPSSGRRSDLVAALGLAVTVSSLMMPRRLWLHDWLLPPLLLLLGYWSSGGLFVRPSARAEAVLIRFDRRLGIPLAHAPRLLAECLEAAYLSIYPLVGLAFVLFITVTPAPRLDRFWSVVLITDYLCFAMLPWVQTRPPRALEPRAPWRSSVRRVNLRLLGSTSIHVNTCPSGHAAEAAALALLLSAAPLPLVLGMAVMALAISAGAVLGRYHYALDALGGWLVAVAVWLLVT